MSDQAHRGARTPGPMAQPADRRIVEIDEALRILEATSGLLPQTGFLRDAARAAQNRQNALGHPGNLTRGVIIHALPYVNWYKVQAGDGAGWVMAVALEQTGLVPLGPRSTGVYPPNSNVLLYQQPGLNHAHILGSIPPPLADGSIINPDWVQQGGGSGIKREQAHMFPIRGFPKRGATNGAALSGVIDWSANRPLDETSLMKGWITPTGLAILIDDFQALMRVNEQCGLFLNWFDSYCRLAGVNMDIESAVHSLHARDDEGETRYFLGVCTYPWEAVGLYDHGQAYTKENDDKAVQYSLHEGKVDLLEQNIQPIFRTGEYGGYLGQGHFRTVMKPAKDTGIRKYSDRDADEGLFRETISLDGTYSLVSAKRIHIGKRVKIIVPKEVRLPEDKQGDDAEGNNYKFSSEFGGGPDHKIKDIKVSGDTKHMQRVAGVQDIMAYIVNWQALHPFHYHQGDYFTPQESEASTNFDRVIDTLDFDTLEDDTLMRDPTPIPMKIDNRYNEVDYFERESFLIFHDDGSVQLGCGYGSAITMAGGMLSLEAPGQIRILPGTELLAMAGQICLRAEGSMDFSSAKKDMRFKAEQNMQFLAGNDGRRGGMLFETKASGVTQTYKNRFGEDVVSHGIVFKAKESQIALLSKDIYLRTGQADLGEGDIIIDAGKGTRKCYIYANEFNTFTTKAVQFNYGPAEEDSTVNKVYYFGDKTCIMDVQLLLKDKLISYGDQGGAVLNGGCYGMKSFATAGVMADKKGNLLGKVPASFGSVLSGILGSVQTALPELADGAGMRHKSAYVEKYYQDSSLGNDELVQDLGFSFRDPPGSPKQYKTTKLKFPEPRWQMLQRFGMASGSGFSWEETPVVYQGEETYPWPGKKKWKEDPVFLQYKELGLFDAGTGCAKDRPGPYEDPQLSDLDTVTMEDGFKTNRPQT